MAVSRYAAQCVSWMTNCLLCWPKHAVPLLISAAHRSQHQLPIGDCFGLAPSLEVTQRIAKFQMLSFIINSDAQMRKNTASLSNPKVGWVTGSWVGEERFRRELSKWLGRNTYRIHGVFYRVTFSAENEKEAPSLMKSRCLTMVLHSNDDKITVIYFI